jgi:hypothetical protein
MTARISLPHLVLLLLRRRHVFQVLDGPNDDLRRDALDT